MPQTMPADQKLCLGTAFTAGFLIVAYLFGQLFYLIVPSRHVVIWKRFGKVTSTVADDPGFYFKWPIDSSVVMFTGPDKDSIHYNCGTIDGIRFEGVVDITNQLIKEDAVQTYKIHGAEPDASNIKDLTEFLIQGICAKLTAREFFVGKFTKIDDMLYTKLVQAQIQAKSGLRIIEGKVKVYKPKATNSNIEDTIKQEAEHQQSTKTAAEQQKLDQKMAELALDKQLSFDKLEKAKNQAVENRLDDTQQAQMERLYDKMIAEQGRQQIQHEMKITAVKSIATQQIIAANATAQSLMIKADAKATATKSEAAANEFLLTVQYLELRRSEAIANNSKIYSGEFIKDMFQFIK